MKWGMSIGGVLALAVGILWAAGVFSGSDALPAAEGSTFTVHKGELSITLTERGTLKARNSTIIRPEVSGKIEWLIEEGTKVKKGDKLAQLDTEDMKQRVETLENQVTQLEAEFKSAKTQETIQANQNKTNIEKSALALEVAKVTLEKLLKGDIPQKERDLDINIDKAQSAVNVHEQSYDSAKKLLKEDFITKTQFDQEELNLHQAQVSLQSAKMAKDLYEKYEKPIAIKKAQSDVTEAERNVTRATIEADAQLESKKAIVKQKEITLDASRERLKKAQDDVAKMTITAPQAGTVLYGDPDNPWTAQNVKVGNQVYPNFHLMTLPDPSQMSVLVEVHEADIDKVKKGMVAYVTSETRKDVTFEGKVSKIDAVPNTGRHWGGNDIKTFKVEIAIEGKNLDLRPGTSAEAQIRIDTLENVSYIPIQAVQAEEGKFFCYVDTGNKPERRAIDVGRTSENYIQVTKGLSDGDKVLLYNPKAPKSEEGAQQPVASNS